MDITARLAGRTLAEAAQAMRAEINAGKSQLDDASRDGEQEVLVRWMAEHQVKKTPTLRALHAWERPDTVGTRAGAAYPK